MRSTLYPTVVAMLFISMVQPVHSQTNSVAIGSTTPDKDAVLLLVANGNQGLIIPKVNLSGAPSGFGKSGMIVYNTQDNKVYYYDGGTSAWKTVGSVGTSSGPILSATQVLTGDGTVNSGTVLSGDASINAGVVTIKGIEGKVLPSLPGTLQYLAYDGTTGTWKFQTPGGSGTVTQVISGTGLTGGPITTSGTLNVDVGTTANKIVQLDANAKLPAVNGSQVTTLNATNITTGTLGLANGGTGITTSAPGNNKILSTDGTGAVNWAAVSGDVSLSSGALTVSKLNGKTLPAFASGALTSDASGNLTWVPASGTGTVTQVSAGTGLTGGPITTSGTLTVDVGTTANKIVQLDASGKLPAVDGSQLTNLPSSPVADGSITGGSAGAGVKLAAATITDANISATAGIADTKLATISTGGKVSGSAITTGTIGGNTIINTTGNVTAGNISGNGSGLTTLNATNISSGTLSLSRLTSGTNGQVLTVSGGVPIWQAPAASGTVTQVSSGTGLTGGPITTTGTLAVNVGTAANQIVQLDASAKLPAVDGSQLTALNATNISAGTLSLSRLTTGTNGNVLTMSAGVPVWQTPAASGTVTQVSSGTGLTGGPITTTGTLAVNVGTAANQIVQLDASAKLPAVNGSQLTALSATNITTGTLALANGGTGINNSTPGNNKLLSTDATGVVNWTAISGDVSLLSGVVTVSKLNGKVLPAFTSGALTSDASGNLTWVPASGTGTVTQVSAGTGLTGGPITTSGTLNVDVGTTANKIVQLDASAKLPAVDGSQLTGLNAANITTGTLPVANGGTGAITAAAARTSLGALSTALTSGKIFVGSAGNVATGVTMSGDATLSNAGALTLANSSVTRTNLGLGTLSTLSAVTTTEITDGTIADADVSTTAAIAGTKIVPTFGAQNVSTTSGILAGSAGQFKINNTGNIVQVNNVTTSFPSAQGAVNSVMTNDGSGNLSWTSPSSTLWTLTGNTGTSPATNFLGTTDAKDLVFKTNNTEYARLTSTGNLGLGVTNPSAKLQVQNGTIAPGAGNGNIEVHTANGSGGAILADYSTVGDGTGTVYSRGAVSDYEANATGTNNMGVWGHQFGNGSGGWGVLASNGASLTSPTTYAGLGGTAYPGIFMGGNVGIGRTNPSEALDVYGTTGTSILVEDSPGAAGGATASLKLNAYGNVLFGGPTQNNYEISGNTILPFLSFTLNGNGLATMSTIYLIPGSDNGMSLGSSGNRWTYVYAANGTIQTSDIRLKTNIKPLNYGLPEVLKLKPVSYSWKNQKDSKKIGLIAQEVQRLIPEVVTEGEYLGMNYAELVPVLVKAIQEQQKMIESLKGQLQEKADSSVSKEISELRKELSEMKKTLGLETKASVNK